MDCPFCDAGPMMTKSGRGEGLISELPGWHCMKCNISLIVTNPSYLPPDIWKHHPSCQRRAIAWKKIGKKRGRLIR